MFNTLTYPHTPLTPSLPLSFSPSLFPPHRSLPNFIKGTKSSDAKAAPLQKYVKKSPAPAPARPPRPLRATAPLNHFSTRPPSVPALPPPQWARATGRTTTSRRRPRMASNGKPSSAPDAICSVTEVRGRDVVCVLTTHNNIKKARTRT